VGASRLKLPAFRRRICRSLLAFVPFLGHPSPVYPLKHLLFDQEFPPPLLLVEVRSRRPKSEYPRHTLFLEVHFL